MLVQEHQSGCYLSGEECGEVDGEARLLHGMVHQVCQTLKCQYKMCVPTSALNQFHYEVQVARGLKASYTMNKEWAPLHGQNVFFCLCLTCKRPMTMREVYQGGIDIVLTDNRRLLEHLKREALQGVSFREMAKQNSPSWAASLG